LDRLAILAQERRDAYDAIRYQLLDLGCQEAPVAITAAWDRLLREIPFEDPEREANEKVIFAWFDRWHRNHRYRSHRRRPRRTF
jgi:hypothetical protein